MKEIHSHLLDRITDAFVALDGEWRFVFVNPQAASLLGSDRLDLLGSGIWDKFPTLVGGAFHTACFLAMERQDPVRIEHHSERLGRWIENRIYPSPDGLTVLFTDVTERREHEAKLRQYRDIFRLAEVGLVIGTGDGATLETMNPAFARMHGYEADELQGRPVRDVYAPEAWDTLPSHIRRTEELGHNVYESLHLHRDGTVFPVSVDTTAVRDEQGYVLYRIVNVTDITGRVRTEAALQAAARRVEALLASLHVGVLVEDDEGQIVLANQALCDMMGMGISPEALIGVRMALFGQRIRSLFTEPERLLRRLMDIRSARHPSQGEELTLTDGRVFEVDYSPVFASPVSGETGGGCHLWQLRDVTDRREIERRLRRATAVLDDQKKELERQKGEVEKANARLERLAATDGLTGLLNHRVFEERLAEEFLRARRYGVPLSLVILDVDRFKDYNDSFGHLAGNAVLKELASVLTEHARETDLAVRFGGEEFALILTHTEAGDAAALAERLRAALEERHLVTASFGVCALTPDMSGPPELIAHADAAMYRAKAGGRNLVIVADPL